MSASQSNGQLPISTIFYRQNVRIVAEIRVLASGVSEPCAYQSQNTTKGISRRACLGGAFAFAFAFAFAVAVAVVLALVALSSVVARACRFAKRGTSDSSSESYEWV